MPLYGRCQEQQTTATVPATNENKRICSKLLLVLCRFEKKPSGIHHWDNDILNTFSVKASSWATFRTARHSLASSEGRKPFAAKKHANLSNGIGTGLSRRFSGSKVWSSRQWKARRTKQMKLGRVTLETTPTAVQSATLYEAPDLKIYRGVPKVHTDQSGN